MLSVDTNVNESDIYDEEELASEMTSTVKKGSVSLIHHLHTAKLLVGGKSCKPHSKIRRRTRLSGP